MLVCRKHRFVFVKTRKTGGTSAEIALSRACGDDDVIPPLARRDETLREAEGGCPPRNWAKRIREHRSPREWRRLVLRGRRAHRFMPHASAAEIRAWMGDQVWRDYMTFTIERNPWDRAVSVYWWMVHRWDNRGRRIPPFGEALHYLAEHRPHLLSNWHLYAENDELLVDRVLLHEDLQNGLDSVAAALGLPEESFRLPEVRAKGDIRKSGPDYREQFSSADRELVAQTCRREIHRFGYEF